MDSIPINIFFLVFLTTLTGSFIQAIWILCKEIWGHKNPLAVYAGLKIVCIGYIIPVIYILSLCHFHNSFYAENKDHEIVKKLQLIPFFYSGIYILAIIWICLFLLVVSYRVMEYLNWKSYIKVGILEADTATVEILKSCAETLSIKKIPEIHKKAGLSSPLCTGIFVKMILLPDVEYSKKELEVIFMHELTHMKKHDLEMKWIAVAITMFHCFNPMAYELFKQISIWSEIQCDIYACEKGKDKFTIKNYYGVILKIMTENRNKKVKDFIITALAEKSSDIIVRVRNVKDYKKTKNNMRFLVGFTIILALAGGTMLSYVVSVRILKQYDEYVNGSFLDEFEKQENEKEIVIENFNEKYKIIDDKNIKLLEMKEEYQNKWKLDGRKTYNVGEIYCREGDTVSVHCVFLEDSDKYIEVGIIDQEHNARYVQNKNFVIYSFNIEKSGYYSIFIKNMDSSDVKVGFTYYL